MFKNILESSQTFQSNNHIVFRYKKQDVPFVGFIVGRKFGNAVIRNRFKNQARNLYNQFYSQKSCALIIRPLKSNLQYIDLEKAFGELRREIII